MAVESLGSYGRQALAAVVAGDVDQVNQLVAAGTLQLGAIDTATRALEASLDEIPDVGDGSELLLSPEVQDRYEGLVPTPDFTNGLDDDWRTFTGRALDAANLNALLARHDQETAAAAQQGVQEKYPQALLLLDVSDATIRQMKAVRDRLAATTDVSTLTRWIERAEQYDAALRHLYEVLVDADGKVTKEVRAAFEGEQDARKRLPVDTRPLVVIMADVAQGGLNQVVISIEETRQSLSDALQIQRQIEQDEDVGSTGSEPRDRLAQRREATYTHPHVSAAVAAPSPHRRAATLREDLPLRIRIVTGQPWDARADVLVVPVVGDPDFAGPLGEVDRRAGGELAALPPSASCAASGSAPRSGAGASCPSHASSRSRPGRPTSSIARSCARSARPASGG